MKGNQATLMRALYEAGHTQRWHTVPHHGEALVNSHSWGLAVFILTFHDGLPSTDELDAPPGPSMRLIRAALLHDVHERWSGDCPSPARRAFPGLQEGENEAQSRFWRWAQPLWADESEWHPEMCLSEREMAWLKLGDAVEAWLWTKHQWALGNQHVANPNHVMWKAIVAILKKFEHCFLDADGLQRAIAEVTLKNRLPDDINELEENF